MFVFLTEFTSPYMSIHNIILYTTVNKVKNYTLLGYHAACNSNSLRTFRDKLSVPKRP